MKIWANKLILLCLASLVLFACEKDEEQAVYQLGDAPVLNATATTLVLEEAKANETAVTFNWAAADYGVRSAISYTLEFAKQGDNFADAVPVATGNAKTRAFTVAELNALALQVGVEAYSPEAIDVRVRANVAPSVPAVYSNVTTVTATAYLSEPPYPTLYIVGPASEHDWDGAKGMPMFRDETDPFVYTYTGYLEQGDMFVLGYPNQWGPMWGTNAQGTLSFRPKDTDPEPWKIWVPATGYYTFTMNLKNLNFTLNEYAATGKPTYASVGITGSFNSWAIVPMAKSTFNPHHWTLDFTLPADSELKLATPGWGTQWGATGNWSSLYGKLGLGAGGNLWILAGDYRLLFNDLTGQYVLIER
ncbi:SusE domain-containing protein [Sabulibacter ruber]|uniref:SusE domain-containing protein n=1 Tax=Sabulibacter ruber TaxID=2811901 RepID=UPI001A979942|nr:SusE domain-containing protein [Sabulibacter ruber]